MPYSTAGGADPQGSPRYDRQTVRVALDSWPGTARLCLIHLAMDISMDVLTWPTSANSPAEPVIICVNAVPHHSREQQCDKSRVLIYCMTGI